MCAAQSRLCHHVRAERELSSQHQAQLSLRTQLSRSADATSPFGCDVHDGEQSAQLLHVLHLVGPGRRCCAVIGVTITHLLPLTLLLTPPVQLP